MDQPPPHPLNSHPGQKTASWIKNPRKNAPKQTQTIKSTTAAARAASAVSTKFRAAAAAVTLAAHRGGGGGGRGGGGGIGGGRSRGGCAKVGRARVAPRPQSAAMKRSTAIAVSRQR